MAAQILMDGKGLLADFVYNQLSENYSHKASKYFRRGF